MTAAFQLFNNGNCASTSFGCCLIIFSAAFSIDRPISLSGGAAILSPNKDLEKIGAAGGGGGGEANGVSVKAVERLLIPCLARLATSAEKGLPGVNISANSCRTDVWSYRS